MKIIYEIDNPVSFLSPKFWSLELWKLMTVPLQHVWAANNFIDEWTDPEDTWS